MYVFSEAERFIRAGEGQEVDEQKTEESEAAENNSARRMQKSLQLYRLNTVSAHISAPGFTRMCVCQSRAFNAV